MNGLYQSNKWILKDAEKWTLKNHIFSIFDKLSKASDDAYDLGRWLTLQGLLNERVAEDVASNHHDFSLN